MGHSPAARRPSLKDCGVQGARRPGGVRGGAPLLSSPVEFWSRSACVSPRTVLIAAAAFGAEDGGESVEGGAGVGMGIEPAAAFGADAAPLAHEKGAAEEVRPDLHAVEAPLVTVGSDADEGGFFREERELDGLRAGCFARFGHDDPGSVTPFAGGWWENRGFRVDFGGRAAAMIQYFP
jgi:hypothetical protein